MHLNKWILYLHKKDKYNTYMLILIFVGYEEKSTYNNSFMEFGLNESERARCHDVHTITKV